MTKLKEMLAEAMARPESTIGAGPAHGIKIRAPARWIPPPGKKPTGKPIPPPSHGRSAVTGSARAGATTGSARPGANTGASVGSAAAGAAPPHKIRPVSLARGASAPAVPERSTPPVVPRPSGQGPSSASGTESGRFCVCGAADDNDEETFIKCSIGTGGCNGWVHLRCSELPAAEMDAIILDKKMPARYICRLCRGAGRGRRGTVPTAAGPAGGTTQEMDVSIGHLYFTLTALLIFLPCVSVLLGHRRGNEGGHRRKRPCRRGKV